MTRNISRTDRPGEKVTAQPASIEQMLGWFRAGLALQQQGQLAQASTVYQQLLGTYPAYSEAWHMLGVIASQSGNPIQAIELISKAIETNPHNASAYASRGNLLLGLKRYPQAIDSYDKAVSIKPDYAEIYFNRGIALYQCQQYLAAIASYDKAIAYAPGVAESYTNRGLALNDSKQHQAAIDSYDRAIALKPDSADTFYNRGLALKDLKHYQAAIVSFNRTYALSPDYEFLGGTRLDTKMKICDWHGVSDDLEALSTKIQSGAKASEPFIVLACTTSRQLQLKAAQIWVNHKAPANQSLDCIPIRPKGRKIRLGYFSSDFRNHAVAHLVAELFEMHDKNSFELIAFSYGRDANDAMRQRISAAFDQFIVVGNQSDRDVALLSRSKKIDIAIDLNGFTCDNRAGIFALKAAPLQVSYMGYPGTSGASYMDYLVADKILIPEDSRQYFSEKIVYLPNSYQVNDRKRAISDKRFTREELGLPDDGFVFCCFNNNHKITPETFDGWMRILGQVEGSVLWLLEDNPWVAPNLRKEAARRGINPDRLVFAPRMPPPEHLARHRQADLFVDTLPYNAHTTASDALWAGLPVLTCMGEAFASRVAASLLNAIELPELVTSTPTAFESRAIELATQPKTMAAIKLKLEQNRLSTALFDSRLFCRHLEVAYQQMYSTYHAGLNPDHIFVTQ